MSYSLNRDVKEFWILFNYIQQVKLITSPMLFRQVDDFILKIAFITGNVP